MKKKPKVGDEVIYDNHILRIIKITHCPDRHGNGCEDCPGEITLDGNEDAGGCYKNSDGWMILHNTPARKILKLLKERMTIGDVMNR